MNQHFAQQNFNRLPGSKMHDEHYSAYQQASHQQNYKQSIGLHNSHHLSSTAAGPPNVSMQFVPPTADPLGSASTHLTFHPQMVHQNTTFQRNTMSHKQVTSGNWVPSVSTATISACRNNMQMNGSISSHQPVNGHYITQTTHQPEFSLQQTSLAAQSNKMAQKMYINRAQMTVGNYASGSSDNQSPSTDYSRQVDQTNNFFNQGPVSSSFDFQSPPVPHSRWNSVVSHINESMIKSPTTTQWQPPQNSLRHSVIQSHSNKTKNQALFLHEENVKHQAGFFGDLKKAATKEALQKCNTIPTSSHHSMRYLYDTVACQANTHPQVVQSNNMINVMPRITQMTTLQQSYTVPTSSHRSMTSLYDAVTSRVDSHPQVVQSNNTISEMPTISQDTTLGTQTHKSPPPENTESNQDSQNSFLKTIFINQGRVQNPVTSNNPPSSVASRSSSQCVSQHNLQGQRTEQSASVASCQQVRPSSSHCNVSVNPSEEIQKVSECQPPVKRTDVSNRKQGNLDSILGAVYNQGCDMTYSRALVQIISDDNHGQVQYCKDPAETFEVVMALQKVTRQTQKAVAVVSPISQKSSFSGENNVNASPDDCLPKIDAGWTLPENVEKQSNAIMQPENIKPHQIHSSSIPATLESNRPEKECSHNNPASDSPSFDIHQLPSSVCSSDLLQNGQNIDFSKNEKLVDLAKQNHLATTHFIKIIKYLLNNQSSKHSQVKKNSDFLKDGHDSSVKYSLNVSTDVQKIDSFTNKQNHETSNIAQNTMSPNVLQNVTPIMSSDNELNMETSHDAHNIETCCDGQYKKSLNSEQNAEGSNDGRTVEPLPELQVIESSHDGLNAQPLDNEQNNSHESSNDPAFDLSKVQVANFTLEKLQALVKSLEVTAEEKEKEIILNIRQCLMELFWDCSNTKFTEECTDILELLQLASDVSVEDEPTVVLQHLETEQIKMLDGRYQILGNETFSPGHQEFKSSWLNVDGQPANIDSILAEPISDYNLTWCIDNSQLLYDGTPYLDDLNHLGAYDAKADKETAAWSGRSDQCLSNDEFIEHIDKKSNNVDDSDCSHDSQPMVIELLTSDDAKLFFYENPDGHLREKPPHLCQDEVLATPENQPQPNHELSKSNVQSNFLSSDVKFSCCHVNTVVHGDELFCAMCLKETPLLDFDLEESCLSPLESDDQRKSSSPQLCKSDEEPNESKYHQHVCTINPDSVIPKYNESETTKTSKELSQSPDFLSGDSIKEQYLASSKESDSITKPMDEEIQVNKGSTVVKLPKKEHMENLDSRVPPKKKTKNNPSLPKYPPHKKLKTRVPQIYEDLFKPDVVIRKAKIYKKSPRDHKAASFNNGKGEDRTGSIKIPSPLARHSAQYGTFAKKETIDLSNDRPHNAEDLAILTNSDTSQEKPHCFKNNLIKNVRFALYGSTSNSGKMVAHHCHERKKITYAPVYITVSGSLNTTNTDSAFTDIPSAKQKVLNQRSSTFLQAKPNASYKKRKQSECVALKWKIKDLKKKHVVDRNLPVHFK